MQEYDVVFFVIKSTIWRANQLLDNIKIQPWKFLGVISVDGSWINQDDSSNKYFAQNEAYEKMQNTAFRTTLAVIFFVISVVWIIFSFCWDFHISDQDNFNNWFSPSGAVLTLSSLILRLQIVALFDFKQTHMDGPIKMNVSTQSKRIRKILEGIAFFSIFLGTVIWAYGDKLMIQSFL